MKMFRAKRTKAFGSKGKRLFDALIKYNGTVNTFDLWEFHLYGIDIKEAIDELYAQKGIVIERVDAGGSPTWEIK